ncbi:MAG: hypothetical protein ACXVEF_44950 [Polyangiales bacterium]
MRSSAPLFLVLLVGCSAEGSFDGDPATETGADTSVGADTFTQAETSVGDTSSVDTTVSSDAIPEADAPADTSPHVCPTAGAAMDCTPGTGTGEGDQCKDAPSCYLTIVQKAVNGLVSAHPDWFDFTGPSGCPVIKNVDMFLDAVVADVAAHGLCVERDPHAPGEEITVKKDNAFSENFDLVSSAGCARSGAPIYTGYCAPAWW